VKKLVILFVGLCCGALASQFPEYAQQYRQRLAGAVGELERVVVQFDADARKSGLNREQALIRFQESGDGFLSDRGRSIGETISRFERLDAHLIAMNKADPLSRLWVFASGHDRELARDTMEIYEPAVPLTTVGAAHAAGGFALGWLLLSLLLAPFGKRRKEKAAV